MGEFVGLVVMLEFLALGAAGYGFAGVTTALLKSMCQQPVNGVNSLDHVFRDLQTASLCLGIAVVCFCSVWVADGLESAIFANVALAVILAIACCFAAGIQLLEAVTRAVLGDRGSVLEQPR